MRSNNTKPIALHSQAETSAQLFHDWFDPIETGVRDRVRSFIEGMIEAELETALSRPRYGRPTKTRGETDNVPASLSGHRHGHRSRSLLGTFGQVRISVPRARLMSADGKTCEWKSKTLPAYQRRTRAADALIAGAYLSGTNTRRVRRALAALFGGAVGRPAIAFSLSPRSRTLAGGPRSLTGARSHHDYRGLYGHCAEPVQRALARVSRGPVGLQYSRDSRVDGHVSARGLPNGTRAISFACRPPHQPAR